MSDFLLNLSSNPQTRNLIKKAGLPIPMPEPLRRTKGPMADRPLHDYDVFVYTTAKSKLAPVLATTLAEAGANPYVFGDPEVMSFFKDPGEAFGRPAKVLELVEGEKPPVKPRALVCDASGITDPAGLKALYDFFHPVIRSLGKCGRVVLLGRPPQDQKSTLTAAAQGGLSGFMRSVAKEIGKKGSTSQLLYVQDGAEDRVAGPLRFLLSTDSSYVTGQPLTVTKVAKAVDETTGWTGTLDGKVALVTGAARGIGAATARILAGEGAKVVCLDLPNDDGPTSQLAREIGGGVLLQDLAAPDAPAQICERLQEGYGGVDIVVHNAGVTRDKTLANMKPDWWDLALEVNLGAVARLTDALLEGTLHKGGRLICLSSIAGIAGNMGQTNYASAKSGLIEYVRHLSGGIAAKGITINAVAPGFIETRLTNAMPFAMREVARRLNALGQGGLPADVGRAITFFATPGSVGLTGQVMRVCGQSLVGA